MSITTDGEFLERVAAVRTFNRFYTQQIGVLHESLAQSPFSLTEARVLYELVHRAESTATQLGDRLGLDPGYLSRILASFAQRGLIKRERCDRRPAEHFETDQRRSGGIRYFEPGFAE